MGVDTGVEWATDSWHPIKGCSKCSPGCRYCWAEALLKRFHGADGFKLQYNREWVFNKGPVKWEPRNPARRIFACGMTDLLHPDIPDEWLADVLDVVASHPEHEFIFLTKRPQNLVRLARLKRMGLFDPDLPPMNMWLGVSIEMGQFQQRANLLVEGWKGHRFVCYGPLLDDFQLDIPKGLEWCIIEGESGPDARKMPLQMSLKIIAGYEALGLPVFMKQMGNAQARDRGYKSVKGGDPMEWPEQFRKRQYPLQMLRSGIKDVGPKKVWF